RPVLQPAGAQGFPWHGQGRRSVGRDNSLRRCLDHGTESKVEGRGKLTGRWGAPFGIVAS
ncbi:MAG: hypothetical protein M3305_00415, partial [Actinomycetota bacterium]|nr:hypothetical protein [Actinomycetota bacterium]